MLEKVLRYAGELEKLEVYKLSNEEYANFLVLESELTPSDFVLLDELQMCERWKQPVWTKDIWPKSITPDRTWRDSDSPTSLSASSQRRCASNPTQ